MKDRAELGFLLFFLVQAGFIWLLSLPFWAVAQNTEPQIPLIVAALLLAAMALYGETTADRQLSELRNNPENRGLTCRNGWWRYSRHPNYFFEWLHWFAYPLMGWGGEYQYWLWLTPVLMFCFFILVYRHSVYRATGLTQSWRGLPLVLEDHQHVFPVVERDLSLIYLFSIRGDIVE